MTVKGRLEIFIVSGAWYGAAARKNTFTVPLVSDVLPITTTIVVSLAGA
jgi:hypothetical protein